MIIIFRKEKEVDIVLIFLAGIVVFLVCALVYAIFFEPEPIIVTLEEIGGYEDQYIETSAIVTEVIDPSDSRFEFFIFIPINTGKTITLVPIPVFDRYTIYNTEAGVHFAVDKDGEQPKLFKEILIRGTVLKDAKNKPLFCIKVGHWEYQTKTSLYTNFTITHPIIYKICCNRIAFWENVKEKCIVREEV